MSRKLEPGLTPRELEVARLVREGLTDREIAEKLFITRRTAEWHVKQIFNKLGFNSRSQLAAWVVVEETAGLTQHSPDHQRHNLPLQPTTFVGRANELAEIERLLPTRRLLTLTAVGGAGKTRLALEVANGTLDDYPDGAWFVDLTPIKDGKLVARVFGSALGIHERPRQTMAHTLLEHLRDRRLLLVVDNCEHVIDDCALLIDSILRSCPGVFLLATSRERLRVGGEAVWQVAPLAIPDPNSGIDLFELAQYEAVSLFVDRARLAAPGFEMNAENAPAIAQLSRRLDGIPLAIELAAARVGMMSPNQVLDRIEDRFRLLTGGSRAGPARHRTLQSALDWSYDLLSDRERTLFRRLTVFAGTFSLEAVEQVCSGNDLKVAPISALLGSLLDKSLVIAGGAASGSVRFRLLETMQQYGRERLIESGETDELDQRHFEFFLSLAEDASLRLIGREQQAWHNRLAHEISNLRVALEWSSGHEPETNLRLCNALTDFWYFQGLVQEGEGWFKRGLAGYALRNELRAKALACGARVSYWRVEFDDYSARSQEALDIYRELGDRPGIGRMLPRVGEAAEWHADFKKAREYYDAALVMAREVQDGSLIAHIQRLLGRLAMKEGDHDGARKYLEESRSYFERIGEQRPTNWALGYLGLNEIESGDLAAARSHLEEALKIARPLDFPLGVATPLMYFAALAAARSQPVRALHLAAASEALGESAGAAPVRLTKPIVEQLLEESRRKLGPGRSAACEEEGRAMTRDHAIEYALKG
jgi:predicted ATPase/DNA-binding CsgD family transcriptional regulator